jgi:hypothetical protein
MLEQSSFVARDEVLAALVGNRTPIAPCNEFMGWLVLRGARDAFQPRCTGVDR